MVTSDAVASMFSGVRGWTVNTGDFSKYILMADVTRWYNSTSTSQTQNVGFMGMLTRYRSSGQQANSTCMITLSVGWYRNNQQLPNDIISNIAKSETSQQSMYSLCIISYENKIYLAIRLNTLQAGINTFFGYSSQQPLLTVLTRNETVTELYVVQ